MYHVCMSFTLNHVLLHNGNKHTDTGDMRPDNTLNGLMFLHRPCSGTAPLTLLHTGGLRCLHQFGIVSVYVLTQICGFENKYTKMRVG